VRKIVSNFGKWQDDGPQTTGRGLMSKKDDDVAEDLMTNHDVFLGSLRSRLTKLQVGPTFYHLNKNTNPSVLCFFINFLKK